MGLDVQIVRESHFEREVLVFKDRPRTLWETLVNTENNFAHKEAIVFGKTRLTYKGFTQLCRNTAAFLSQEWDVEHGDRIALFTNNCIEFCIGVYAAAKLGAVVVPVNARFGSAEVKYVLSNSETSVLIAEPELLKEVVEPIMPELPLLKHVVVTSDTRVNNAVPFKLMSNYLNFEESEVNVNEDDAAFIMYTSGTTGIPKGAVGTHLNMIHSMMNYNNIMETTHEERTLICVPLFHVTGFIAQLLHIIYAGGTVVLMTRYKTDLFTKLMDDERISYIIVVPTIYVFLVNYMRANPEYKLPKFKIAAYGGAPMAPATIKELSALLPGIRLFNAYGATETSSGPTTLLTPDVALNMSESVGKPVPVAECKVVDETGEEVPRGTAGELWIKGPIVIPGYWKNNDANIQNFTNGYWHSGDIAKMDDECYIYIMDRKKDMINRGGEKIFSVEVEEVLYRHPKVLEVAIVGVPDEVFGEEVKAVIVPKPDQQVDDEEIRAFVASNLAEYKVPKFVEILAELPRNPGGKVLKSQLRYKP
ncbi:acyl--CoA ligase [Metallumcola ferriviriculae]|uniref:Acyl--CoA ligase n=1 Tax=Metallumcola ferriviriculae TaxID=3039180 RepID=A0AAU0USQ3_9FIRM|nr:acyl--CoA ligase [Desulfitibacteraceae bacterium MK1]